MVPFYISMLVCLIDCKIPNPHMNNMGEEQSSFTAFYFGFTP